MIEGHGHLFCTPTTKCRGTTGAARSAGAAHRARGDAGARDIARGFTTERDLGTEGAGYADVGLRDAIAQGIVPGPRMIVATRAIVARGAYGPKGFEPGTAYRWAPRKCRASMKSCAPRAADRGRRDVVKLYADYHYQRGEPSRPR